MFYSASFPDGGELAFYGRSAATAAGLPGADEVLLGTRSEPVGSVPVAAHMTAAGEDPTRRFFRLRIELRRGGESPVLHEYVLEEYCE